MNHLPVFFCLLVYSEAQHFIHPNENDRIINPFPHYHPANFKSALYSPAGSGAAAAATNPFNTIIPNEVPPLHDVLPKNWSDHVINIISNGITKFALDMDNAISKTRSSQLPIENTVFSPLSLAGTMAIVLLGAGGKTFDEVTKILGLESGIDVSRHSEVVHEIFGLLISMVNSNKSSFEPQATYASGVFVQEGFSVRPEFQMINKNVYKSEIIHLDFHNRGEEAKRAINKWVSDRTHCQITEIITSIPDPDTDVILASALYFSGEWNQYFLDSATKRRPFSIEPGQSVYADMMLNGGDFPFYQDNKLGVKILGLPYKGCEMIMYVLLPNTPGVKALRDFERNLNPIILENLINKMKNQTCIVAFPKMKLSSSLSLKRALQSLGLNSVFDPVKADLSLLSSGGQEESSFLSEQSIDSEPKESADILQLRPQDGFYFPPRMREENAEGNVESEHSSSAKKKRHYFRYEDKTSRYSIEQWANGYKIARIRREGSEKKQEIERDNMSTTDSIVSNQSTIDANLMNQRGSEPGREKDRTGKQMRESRQTRPIDQDFLNFLNSQNLSVFGLDTLRNSPNIKNPGLYVGNILHRVEININEKGTEAAAATAVVLERTGSQKRFIANRPFLFLIRHEQSKLIWFWGSINLPTPNYPL